MRVWRWRWAGRERGVSWRRERRCPMATMTIDEIQLPTDFSVVTDEQLDELDEVARAAADPIVKKYNEGESLSDDELNTLERLSGVVAGGRGQADARGKAAAQ